jgi:integrase
VRRSGKAVVRTIPLPDFVVADLDLVHGIEFAQRAADRGLTAPALWPWSHVTVWNKINRLMELARIEPGPHATARGLRHGFATLVLANDVPLDLLQTWMGHSSIYATRRAYDRQRRSSLTVRDYSDVEQRKFADRIWSALLCEASQDSPR